MEKKKDTMRFYDATASSYEELYGKEQQNKYDAALKAIEDNRLGKVLDVGCGPAVFLGRISSNSTLRVGVDISHQMLATARSTDTPSTHVLCADADFLPVRDCVFDSVFAFTLLQNMPRPTSTLREMFRVVRSGGMIVITLPTRSALGREAHRWLRELDVSYREVDAISSKDRILICRRPFFVDEPKRF